MDVLISGIDRALRTLTGTYTSRRPNPAQASDASFCESDRRCSVALMRVNHSGEVCAQALYHSQSLFAESPSVRTALEESAREEGDHLQWTADRIEELGGRRSFLDPLWYAGAFAIGAVAAKRGDKVSLGFLKETECQVVAHLGRHLERLPNDDQRSREIVRQMSQDEAAHAELANSLGAVEFPAVVRLLMKASAKVMTGTAYYV